MKTDKQIEFEKELLTNVYMVEGGRLKACVAVENILLAVKKLEAEPEKPELPEEWKEFFVDSETDKNSFSLGHIMQTQNKIIRYLRAQG